LFVCLSERVVLIKNRQTGRGGFVFVVDKGFFMVLKIAVNPT